MQRKHLALLLLLPLLIVIGCENPIIPDPDPDPDYELGDFELRDTGPAGGLIFYIDEANEFDWTFLEAAPASTEWDGIAWGIDPNDDNIDIGTATDIGTGKENTRLIVAWLNDQSATGKAAQLCDGLTSGGYSDWFLPSKAEHEKMMEELFEYESESNVGGFSNPSSDRYWSSTESTATHAYCRTPDTKWGWNGSMKNSEYKRVRAVRSF